MQQAQLQILSIWYTAGDRLQMAVDRMREDRGEVTGQTALIVLLVTAAIAAGIAIAAAIAANTAAIPAP